MVTVVPDMKPIPFNTEMTQAIWDDRKNTTRRVVKHTDHDVYKIACAMGLWYETYDPRNPPESLVELYVKSVAKPPYQPREILYVPEAWRCFGYIDLGTTDYCVEFRDRKIARFNFQSMERAEKWAKYLYKPRRHWQSPYFMPREAARLFLRVTGVRVERLQDISNEDVLREGIQPRWYKPYRADGKRDIPKYGRDSLGRPYCCAFHVDDCIDKPCQIRAGHERVSHVEPFIETWDKTIKPADYGRYGWAANPWVWVIEFERCEKPEK